MARSSLAAPWAGCATAAPPLAMSAASITKPKRPNPYADAPRLPEGEQVDPGQLVRPGLPLEIEIGPGRGGFLFERLAAVPELVMLGFEIRRKYATLVDNKLKAQGLGERARVFCEDARLALPRLPAAVAQRGTLRSAPRDGDERRAVPPDHAGPAHRAPSLSLITLSATGPALETGAEPPLHTPMCLKVISFAAN